MAQAKSLTRIFRTGSIQLPDPDPSMSVERVKEVYSVNYPFLATAIIDNPDNPLIEGDKMVYVFVPAPVKTKG